MFSWIHDGTWSKPLSWWRHTDGPNQTTVTSIHLNTRVIMSATKTAKVWNHPFALCLKVVCFYQRLSCRERLQVFWFGKFGNQIFRIHVHLQAEKVSNVTGIKHSSPWWIKDWISGSYPHLPLSGTQVKIKAALKPLVDKTRKRWNLTKTGELLGNERQLPVRRILLIPQSLL